MEKKNEIQKIIVNKAKLINVWVTSRFCFAHWRTERVEITEHIFFYVGWVLGQGHNWITPCGLYKHGFDPPDGSLSFCFTGRNSRPGNILSNIQNVKKMGDESVSWGKTKDLFDKVGLKAPKLTEKLLLKSSL